MVEMVQCSNGHNFPVNMKKHRNRTYVICPHAGCYEKVKIRRRRLPFSKLWSKQREQQRQIKREIKEQGRKGRETPMIMVPGFLQGLAANLAVSMAMLKQKKEEEEKSG